MTEDPIVHSNKGELGSVFYIGHVFESQAMVGVDR
jgi:hypothetical protein